MSYPTPKEIKKLAMACRTAGIKTFKSGEIEFTLTDEAPLTKAQKRGGSNTTQTPTSFTQSDTIETDDLSENELLLWSVGANAPDQSDESKDSNGAPI